MTPGFDPLNIILLVAAVIIFWKLKSVLGQRTGFERPPIDLSQPGTAKRAEKPVSTPVLVPEAERSGAESGKPVWHGYADEGSGLASSLEAISRASNGLDVAGFINGARLAYEMILEAFAKDDKAALKPLLSKEVFESFASAIDERLRKGQKMIFQFVAVKSATLDSAQLDGKRAALSVRFLSEMISATTDRDGKVIEGDAKAIREISDLWTFERDVTSRDPNWKLVATDEGVA